MQVYCNGTEEHYIDLACPFGKTNSTLEFCPPVSLFAKSAARAYAAEKNCIEPILGSHVDDIFGGFPFCSSYERALDFRSYMCEVGRNLSVRFNMKASKTPLPARKQIILGGLWDSKNKHVRTSPKKREKYLSRITELLSKNECVAKEVHKLHGNLNYAAQVAPFGRPFLAPLTNLVTGKNLTDTVIIDDMARRSLRVWERILIANRGISFKFVLGQLPQCPFDIFFDVSDEWGIGGCCGPNYFAYP